MRSIADIPKVSEIGKLPSKKRNYSIEGKKHINLKKKLDE